MHDRARTESGGPLKAKSQATAISVVVLIALAIATAQILIGGVKLVYALPAYAALGLAGLAAVFLRRPGNAGRPIAVCLVGAVALAAYVIWRSLNSPVQYLARPDLYMVIAAFVSYTLTAIHFPGSRLRLWLLWALFGLAMFHVGIGIKQFSEKQNFMLLPWMFRPDYGYRASGFYICPNHLAGLLEMLGMMALSITLWGRVKPGLRILAGYFFVVTLAGVAMTGSRGGYLSTVGGLLTFGVLSLWVVRHVQKRWFWGVLILTLVGLAGLIGATVWVMSKSSHLEQRLTQVYDPTNMRIFMWKAALQAHQLSEWTGVGSGTYLYYGRHFRDPSIQNDAQHVHNDYLELLTEYGILGCIVMGLFLVPHLIAGFAGIRGLVRERLRPLRVARSNELALLIGALSGLAALVFHSVIDFNLHIPANAIVCAMFLGILANPRSEDPDDPLPWRARGSWLRFVAPVIGIALTVISIPPIAAEYYGERARMCVRDQMSADAIRYAERALAADPKNPRLYYYLGEGKHNLAMLEKDPAAQFRLNAEAARAFADGLKHFPLDTQLLLKLARTLDNMQRYGEAEVVFRTALTADPNFGNVYAYYGYHYFLQRRLLRAEKLYQKATELGETEVAPLGLKDIAHYRQMASKEETADFFPVEDLPEDETWEIGEP